MFCLRATKIVLWVINALPAPEAQPAREPWPRLTLTLLPGSFESPFDLTLINGPELWVRSGQLLEAQICLFKSRSWTLSEVIETIREDVQDTQYFSGSGSH